MLPAMYPQRRINIQKVNMEEKLLYVVGGDCEHTDLYQNCISDCKNPIIFYHQNDDHITQT